MRSARQDVRDAFRDTAAVFGQSGRWSGKLQDKLVQLARARIQTFQDAVTAFVTGYREGTQQARCTLLRVLH